MSGKQESEGPRALAVIPARLGSKRLPRKNIAPILGKPMIAYTIEAAKGATKLTDFLVSSESPEIIDVAREYGAPVPFVRPEELSGDAVRNIDVIIHALDFMEDKTGRPYDIIVLLQPTSPIRKPEHIDEAVELLWRSDLNSLASVKGPFKKRDPYIKRITEGVLEAYCTSAENSTDPFYMYNASIYAVKRDYLKKNRKIVDSRQVPLVMDAIHSADVDTYEDLMVAETYLKYLEHTQKDSKS